MPTGSFGVRRPFARNRFLKQPPGEMHMLKWLGVILVVSVASALGQTPPAQYQPGTITAVTAHHGPGQRGTEVTQYDVSVKVGNTTYAVLYSPPNGSNIVTYALGDELLVLVGTKTLTFNTALSGKTVLPILRRATLPAKSPDWLMAPGQYFSMELQHLSEALDLTENQRAAIKPILEQEAGEVGELRYDPVLSQKEKLNRYEAIVRESDGKITPLLSTTQLQKLQDLRKGQMQDLKRLIAEQKSSKQN